MPWLPSVIAEGCLLTALVNDESADSYVRESATSALSRLELVRIDTPRSKDTGILESS